MAIRCEIHEPRSFKQLLELFSGLSKENGAVQQLQKHLDRNGEVKVALKWSDEKPLETFLDKVNTLYEALVKTPDYGNYVPFRFDKLCVVQEVLNHIDRYLLRLYDVLLFLHKHMYMPWTVGFEDWTQQITTAAGSALCQWLTDTDESKYATLKLVKGGFKIDELNSNVTGNNIYAALVHMSTEPPTLAAALFLRNPWEPPRVGDQVAFLKGFCEKLGDESFKHQLETQNRKHYGIKYEELQKVSREVLTTLSGFNDLLTPINEKIYQHLSQAYVSLYLKYLKKGIPALITGLKEVKDAMDNWGQSGPGADPELSKSRFQFGFQGDKWKTKESDIKSAIDMLTGEDGSLTKLFNIIKPSDIDLHPTVNPQMPIIVHPSAGSTVSVDSDKLMSSSRSSKPDTGKPRHSNHSHPSVAPAASRYPNYVIDDQYYQKNYGSGTWGTDTSKSSRNDSSRNGGGFVWGLLGTGAAVATGGVAYVGNIFGFGDMIRGVFSGGTPSAASLTG